MTQPDYFTADWRLIASTWRAWEPLQDLLEESFERRARVAMPPSRCDYTSASFYRIEGTDAVFRDHDFDTVSVDIEKLVDASDKEWDAYCTVQRELFNRLEEERLATARELHAMNERVQARRLLAKYPELKAE